jgi:hypothetical protein
MILEPELISETARIGARPAPHLSAVMERAAMSPANASARTLDGR